MMMQAAFLAASLATNASYMIVAQVMVK